MFNAQSHVLRVDKIFIFIKFLLPGSTLLTYVLGLIFD